MTLSFKEFLEQYTPVKGTQYGSNPGGIHTDEKGNKHYVKYYENGDQAKSEVLASKIYKHMGIHTLDPEYKKINGRHAVVTPWNDHLEQKPKEHYEDLSKKQAHQVGRMYHAAILTKNWDIVGLEHDNIVHNNNTGNLHSVDPGGSFQFRAQGSHKDYGPDIDEHSSLRKPNRPSGHVFGHAFGKFPDAEHKGLEAVRDMDDKHVHGLFKSSGLTNWKDLHKNFSKRRKALLDKYDS